MDTSEDLPVTQEEQCRVEDPHLTCVVEKEVPKEAESRRGPGMKVHWDATNASPLERVDSAISA